MKASEVIQKYNTNNPYEIAKNSKVVVILEPLGNIRGYYNKACGQKFIHVNDKLPMDKRPFVVSHLLYPALKDQDEMYILTGKNNSKFAETANAFALNLVFCSTR